MADAERIMANEAADAYRKTGLGVIQHKFFREDGASACGLAVYAVSIGVASPSDPECKVSVALYKLGFELAYKRGFVCGFDGDRDRDDMDRKSDRWRLGYEDGKAAYDAVKEVAVG